MGYEYSINFELSDKQDIVDILRALPHFEQVIALENRDQYIYRSPENKADLPNALAQIKREGVYFCDNGEGEDILKEMIFRIGLGYKKLEVIDHSD